MITRLYSGKFWLKTLFFGLLVPLLVCLGAHFGLRHLFSEAHIRQAADAALSGSGRQFVFHGGQIERGWFPYPHVVLHQVGLTRPQNQGPALNAESMQISFGWSALWGSTDIHSLSLNGATVYIQQLENGRWEVAGFTADSSGNHALPQRIELDNSSLRIQYGEQKQSLRQVSGFIDRGSGSFDLTASLFTPQEYRLQAAGSYDGSHIEQLQASLAGYLPGGQPFTASWQGNADYTAEQSRLNTQEGRLSMQIPGWALSFTGNTRNWQISPAGIVLPETHIVFTSEPESGQDSAAPLHSGSGSINKAAYHYPSRTLEIGGFQINGTFEQSGASSSYSANGQFQTLPDGGFQADNLFLNTRHTATPRSMPSWVGQWRGSIAGKADGWQAQLQGSLDNNEGYLKISGRPGEENYTIDAEARLAKLSLNGYLPDSGNPEDTAEPLWLKYWPQALRRRQIRLTLDVGTLESAGLQIQNFHSALQLDAQQLRAESIRMQLYEGQATGSATLHSGSRPKWEAALHFSNIQIKPLLQDAFRFNHLSGRGNATFQIGAEGLNRSEWHTTLAGQGQIMLDNGAWQGINLGKLLNQPANLPAQSLIRYNAESSTPFRHFNIEASVENSIGTTPRLSLSSDSLNLSGQGNFDIRNNTLNYAILASAGHGLWLPLKINGSISRPSFALDYQRITGNLQTPEQKQRALQDVLQQQWQWIQKLPENTQP